jgi:hypothetical protein
MVNSHLSQLESNHDIIVIEMVTKSFDEKYGNVLILNMGLVFWLPFAKKLINLKLSITIFFWQNKFYKIETSAI